VFRIPRVQRCLCRSCLCSRTRKSSKPGGRNTNTTPRSQQRLFHTISSLLAPLQRLPSTTPPGQGLALGPTEGGRIAGSPQGQTSSAVAGTSYSASYVLARTVGFHTSCHELIVKLFASTLGSLGCFPFGLTLIGDAQSRALDGERYPVRASKALHDHPESVVVAIFMPSSAQEVDRKEATTGLMA
jgi:hypothetical protein